MDSRIRDQVGLELVNVDIKLTFKAERRGETRNDLSDNTIEVLVRRTLDAKILFADVIDGLIVKHKRAVGVLQESMSGKDRIVGLNDRGGDLRRRINAEIQLGLLAVVSRETLEQEGAEARSSTTTNRVEDKEPLEAIALVGNLANAIQGGIQQVLANGIMATSVIVRGVLLPADELIWMEQLGIRPSTDLVDDGRLKINHDCAWNILA